MEGRAHGSIRDHACWDIVTFTGLQFQIAKRVSENAIMNYCVTNLLMESSSLMLDSTRKKSCPAIRVSAKYGVY